MIRLLFVCEKTTCSVFQLFNIVNINLIQKLMKRIKYLSIFFMLIIALLSFYNCEKDAETIALNTRSKLSLKTVTFKDAKDLFNQDTETSLEKRRYYASKNGETPLSLNPNWSTLKHESMYGIENSELTLADVTVNRDGNYESKLFFLDINNKQEVVIFTLFTKEVAVDGKILEASFFYNKLDGSFISGFKIEKGKLSKRYRIGNQRNINEAGFFMFFQGKEDDDDFWCDDGTGGVLDIVDLGSVNNHSNGGGGSPTGSSTQVIINHSSVNWYYLGNGNSTGQVQQSGGGTSATSGASSLYVNIKEGSENEDTDPNIDPLTGKCKYGYQMNPHTGKCERIPQDPCKYIKFQIQNPNYTKQAEELKSKTGLKKETGYKQNKDGTQIALNDTGTGHSLVIPVDRNTVGYMHTHLNDFESDEIDKRTGEYLMQKPIKIFSPNDVIQFLKIVRYSKYNGVPIHLIYATMISSTGSYTLRFTGDPNDVVNFKSARFYDPLYRKIFKRNKNKEKAFLIFLKKHLNIKGIELYKIKNNGKVIKKSLNSKNKVEDKDCE